MNTQSPVFAAALGKQPAHIVALSCGTRLCVDPYRAAAASADITNKSAVGMSANFSAEAPSSGVVGVSPMKCVLRSYLSAFSAAGVSGKVGYEVALAPLAKDGNTAERVPISAFV